MSSSTSYLVEEKNALRDQGYNIVKSLHKTNYGGAFLARHDLSGQVVFVKISNLSAIRRERSAENPLKEAKCYRDLQATHSEQQTNQEASYHPFCFPKLIDEISVVVSGQDIHFLILENAGEDLCSMLNKYMSNERRLNIWKQLVDAIDLLHNHFGWCHLDLKPENIMIQETQLEDGTNIDIVKICDFGLARYVKHNTLTTGQVGTAMYRAPETDNGMYDGPKADLYSLGATLYALLSNRTLFKSTTDELDNNRAKFMNWVNKSQAKDRRAFFRSVVDDERAVDLLTGLVCPKHQRLSLDDIKAHPFTRDREE